MSKHISTLIQDIYSLFDPTKHVIPSDEVLEGFGNTLKQVLKEKLAEVSEPPVLRLSSLGSKCDRQLWYKINEPFQGTPLPPSAYLKFLYGHIIEATLLALAKIAGHEVTQEQKTVDLYGVKGHIDGKIDGVTVDVKSASTFAFDKFDEGLSEDKDSFGYLVQLGGYEKAISIEEGTEMKPAAFIAMDKQNGFLTMDFHYDDIKNVDYKKLVEDKKAMLQGPLPDRAFDPKPDGYKNVKTKEFVPNGNMKLGVNCSYCDRKFKCWQGLRAFAYAGGPVFFTKVVKEPKVYEYSKEEASKL